MLKVGVIFSGTKNFEKKNHMQLESSEEHPINHAGGEAHDVYKAVGIHG